MTEATDRAALAGIFRVALGEFDEEQRALTLAALAVLARDRAPQAARRAALEAAEPLHTMVAELLEQAADLHADLCEHLEAEAKAGTRQPVAG